MYCNSIYIHTPIKLFHAYIYTHTPIILYIYTNQICSYFKLEFDLISPKPHQKTYIWIQVKITTG